MMNKIKNNQMLLSILGVLVLVALLTGITYAGFSKTSSGGNNSISSGTITMSFQEPSNNVVITNAMPISGYDNYSSTTHFDFSVLGTAKTAMTIPYEISITEKSGNTINPGYVRIGLKKNGTIVYEYGEIASQLNQSNVRNGAKTLIKDKLILTQSGSNYTATDNYQLFMWLSPTYPVPNDGSIASYSVTVNVNSYVQGIGVPFSRYIVRSGGENMRIGYTLPDEAKDRSTAELAMADWNGLYGSTSELPFCLKHVLNNQDEIEESYIVFKVTEDMVTANPGMVAGIYEIRGGNGGSSHTSNVNIMKEAFGYNSYPSRCTSNTRSTTCSVSGLIVSSDNTGYTTARNSESNFYYYCSIQPTISSVCNYDLEA